jgi:hypothetical protein
MRSKAGQCQTADGFCRATPLNELYEKPPVMEMDPATQPDLTIDRSAMWSAFKEAGVAAPHVSGAAAMLMARYPSGHSRSYARDDREESGSANSGSELLA